MKMRTLVFDVELIIDHKLEKNRGEAYYISTHRFYRGIHKKQLNELFKKNELVPIDSTTRITFNIRGVTY